MPEFIENANPPPSQPVGKPEIRQPDTGCPAVGRKLSVFLYCRWPFLFGNERSFFAGEYFLFAGEHFFFAGEHFFFAGEHFLFADEHFFFADEHFFFGNERSFFADEYFFFGSLISKKKHRVARLFFRATHSADLMQSVRCLCSAGRKTDVFVTTRRTLSKSSGPEAV
ncbi:MAG: hypothetical protein R3C49_06010 [Planctomycetaceae bacterium]